ncbi:hypothetical protein BGZ49_002645 [Haplosporangium sp. Z 27]|nr:hypothetical protein BGZ49_002645 [Haplosporangium sp. Z 27]
MADFQERFPDVYENIKAIRGANYFFFNVPTSYKPRSYAESLGALLHLASFNTSTQIQFFEPAMNCDCTTPNSPSGVTVRQPVGRRSDGAVKTKSYNMEILLVECGPKDEGPNGTKILTDGFKIAKGLEDIYDYIMNEVRLNGGDITEAQDELECQDAEFNL